MANGAMDDDAEQFSLRWNNFHSSLSCGFHELLEEKDLVDVTLACDGQYVQAHKIVLTVCSPYFKALFKVNPNTHPIVILKDVNFSDLQAILQFMYRGEVNVKQEDLTNFLKTAEVLKIKGLTGDDKGSVSSRQHSSGSALESTPKTTPLERAPSPASAPPPAKRKRTHEPPPPAPPVTQTVVRSPSPVAPQVSAQPSPIPEAPLGPGSGEVEYIDVSDTKVEPPDYVDEDQYSRDDLNDGDLSLSASDPLSSSSQMLVPPPLMAGPSTSRDSTGKEAMSGMSFAGVAGSSTSHDTSGASAQELSSQASTEHPTGAALPLSQQPGHQTLQQQLQQPQHTMAPCQRASSNAQMACTTNSQNNQPQHPGHQALEQQQQQQPLLQTPHSLGVGITHNRMSVLIPKHTPIPCSKTDVYITAADNQPAMPIVILQGESITDNSENFLLGCFTVHNITRAPRGVTKVEVTYRIDVNGLLKVSATELGNQGQLLVTADTMLPLQQ